MDVWSRIVGAFPAGIIKTAELNAIGVSNSTIRNQVRAGKLRRVRHGYYVLADSEPSEELSLIRKVLPEGVLCGETALYYFGYSDVTPRFFDIAVPRGISRSRLRMDGFLRYVFQHGTVFPQRPFMMLIEPSDLPLRVQADCAFEAAFFR